jgi:hypothetical protein
MNATKYRELPGEYEFHDTSGAPLSDAAGYPK